jgi:serine/threonine protein kinase
VKDLNEKCLREIENLAKISNEFIVKLETYWNEDVKISDSFLEKSQFSEIKKYLFIQMEFCESNLREIITSLTSLLDAEKNHSDLLQIILYLKSELFLEIVEGISYLHSLSPPIIHRDLKPCNILLKAQQNGNHIKIADFGLSVQHERMSQSHTRDVGTTKYVAPEVEEGTNYDEKCDIYSLGILFNELFDTKKLK